MSAQRRYGLERVGQRSSELREEPTPLARASIPPRLASIDERRTPDATPWPDLLNATATLTLDAAAVEQVFAFAFVVGDDGGALATLLDHAPIAASDYQPACFFHELFVEELVQSCMHVRIRQAPVRINQRYLLRLLSQPPRSLETIAGRQRVFRELTDQPAARDALEQLYLQLTQLRKLFGGDDKLGIRGEHARRRLEILGAVRDCFARLSAPAFSACNSHLTRLSQFAEHVRASAGFQQLAALLRYENERAYADLTLQLGADGTVRGLSLREVREDLVSRYHVSAARQWLERAWLWLKGYRITDGEVVDRYLDQVFEGIRPFLPPLMQLIGDLELYLSGLALRDGCASKGLSVCFPEFIDESAARHAGPDIQLDGLFNPLLLALPGVPITCSVSLPDGGVTTLLTGPNSGGKTRLLQALGLAQLCAQAGMYVPAERALLRRVPGIFASLSQPIGAEQAEGRLGTELLRIRMLFERAEPGYLVLIDELCSGTSPSEGEELFRLVLELLVELAPVAVISTHFLRLAAELAADPSAPPARFLQVELDDRQRPTYRFVPGVAETSLAKQTAARLGVTREELSLLLASKRRDRGAR
jgi:DNA mismatch repair protein MutS2